MAGLASKVEKKSLLPAKSESCGSHEQHARRPLSWATLWDSLPDIVVAVASTYFLVFAWLAFVHDGEPLTKAYPSALLQASAYVSLS